MDTRHREACPVHRGLWLSLEPEILAAIAQKLSRRERGVLRLTCKTWCEAVTAGVQSLTVTRQVWNAQLKEVATKFPAVESLDLSAYAWLTNEELLGILKLPRLRRLEVIFGYELSDEGLHQIHKVHTLESLTLTAFSGLRDDNLAHLGKLRGLEELTIQGSPKITGLGLFHLSGLTGLRKAVIGYCSGVSDDCTHAFAQLPHLKDLLLTGLPHFQGSGLSSLQGLSNLTRLVLERTAINDAGVEQLALLTGLRRLSLAHSEHATDRGLEQVTKLPLEWLDLSKCGQITTKGLRILQGNGMVMNSTAVPKAVPRFLYDGNNFAKVEKVPLGFQPTPGRSA